MCSVQDPFPTFPVGFKLLKDSVPKHGGWMAAVFIENISLPNEHRNSSRFFFVL